MTTNGRPEKTPVGFLFAANRSDRRETVRLLRLAGLDVRLLYPSGAPPPSRCVPDLIVADETAARGSLVALLALRERSESSSFLPLAVAARGREDDEGWLRAGFDEVLPLGDGEGPVLARIRWLLRLRSRYGEAPLPFPVLSKALEDERMHFARELHDGVGQWLTAIKLGIEKVLGRMEPGKAPPGLLLEDVVAACRSGIEEARRLGADLRHPLVPSGFLPAFRRLCREFRELHRPLRLAVRIRAREGEIPAPLRPVLYRILQEGLSNVARHSGASQARLSLSVRSGTLAVRLADDGAGFDPREPAGNGGERGGFGIACMRQRATLSGGSFRIETSPGNGTKLFASWPLPAAGEACERKEEGHPWAPKPKALREKGRGRRVPPPARSAGATSTGSGRKGNR